MTDQPNPDRRELVRQALRQIDDLRQRLAQSEAAMTAPIAIIGIGCRYPGGVTDPESFWELLASQTDAITEVPADRWSLADWYDPDPAAKGKTSTRWGGFMTGVDRFDADFFGITPREATLLDPQHRIALEVTYEALEHAGRSIDSLQGSSTGVFIGMTTAEYQQQLMHTLSPENLSPYLVTGNVPNAAAGRIAYSLGLHGPSVMVDTACSSSLTAIHLACQSLRMGDCDTALAGGVNVILSPLTVVMFSQWGMMAPDGRCKTFDAAANGFVRSEGCAMILLKRLDHAKRDGDRVLAVIAGSAINQDGRSSGMTVPNGRAQEALIRKALVNAGVAPGDIDYVEAHGTGTALGDPIELDALGEVFAHGRDSAAKLRVGSVKTNLGHTEAASGIAGLIKCVLAIEHEEIPAQLHFLNPTSQADWDLPIEVVADPMPWPRGQRRRLAGVSSFGFSGGNAHVVVAEPPLAPAREVQPRTQLLTISARDQVALTELANKYVAFLRLTSIPLSDICFTANAGRAAMNERLFVCGDSHASMAAQLETLLARPLGTMPGYAKFIGAPRTGFLFTGQGCQYLGMGRGLYESQPVFRREMDRCALILDEHLDRPLLNILFAAPGEAAPLLDQTRYTQPALFAVEWSLAELWRSIGIVPSAMLGHSLGEYVAACQAGVFTLVDALRLVAKRATLMQGVPPDGLMAAVAADLPGVERFLAPYTDTAIAADNGTKSIVISGGRDAISAIVARMTAEGLSAMPLNVSHAFHSPAMDPILDEYEQLASSISFDAAKIPVFSNLTGRAAVDGDLTTGVYWRRHLRERVRFREGFEAMRGEGCDTLIEIGPDPVLTSMARRMGADPLRCLPSLTRGNNDEERFLKSVGELFIAGAQVNWAGLYHDRPVRRCTLPAYPFRRKRFWVDAAWTQTRASAQPDRIKPELISPLVSERVYSCHLSVASNPDFADHIVAGQVLVPMTAFVNLALDAARRVIGLDRSVLRDVVLAERAVIQDGQTLPMQVVLLPDEAGDSWTFRIISITTERLTGYILHATGNVSATNALAMPAAPPSLTPEMVAIDANQHVQLMEAHNLNFGPAFCGVVQIHRKPGYAIGDIAREVGAAGFSAGLLDVCLQPLIHAWPDAEGSRGFLPFSIDYLEIRGRPTALMRSVCQAQAASPNSETMSGDVTVYDREGNILVRVQGLTARGSHPSADSEVVKGLIYERTWQPVGKIAQRAAAPASFRLPGAAETTIEKHADHLRTATAAGYGEASAMLDQRALALIIAAMGALGLSPAVGERVSAAGIIGQLGIQPHYEPLIGRFLTIMFENGWCERNGVDWKIVELWSVSQVPPLPVARQAKAVAPELRLLERCGAALPQVLLGKIDPLDLLFGQETEGDLEKIYASSLTTTATNEIAADLVAEVRARAPDPGNVSILEIGAGTGGTTTHILKRLGGAAVDYCFTDVGPELVSRARKRFELQPEMTFEVLDIERDLAAQGFGDRQFDIVVAANVLHATGDLAATLLRVRQLLKQGGLLVLIEGIRPQAWIDVTFGLTDGWWKFTDRTLRAEYPLISAPAWQALLETTGFATPLRLDGPAAPGQESNYAVLAANAVAVSPEGCWLLFAQCDELASALRANGESVITVRSGTEWRVVGPGDYVIRPDVREDCNRLLQAIGKTCSGVIHAWAADDAGTDESPAPALMRGTRNLLYLCQALIAKGEAPSRGMWIVTRGAQAAEPDVGRLRPGQASAWGFGKTLGLEHPELQVRRVDLDPACSGLGPVHDLILDPPSQAEIALRAGRRCEPRIAAWQSADIQPVRLVADHTRSLDTLSWQPATRPALQPHEVEIQVEVAALNFRDVLRVLDMYAGAEGDLGGEIAGKVITIGADVRNVKVGDTVGAIAFGGFNTFVKTDAALILAKPQDWSLADIASIPSAFATAYQALVNLAKAQAGETVLIHTASGGVGLAAIQVARSIGCAIIATAGSEAKRAYLRTTGIPHVFDSRSASFAQDIDAILAGGVDIIINTLGADFNDANFAALAERGRFVELGRRELWNPERAAAARPAARYFVMDLAQVASQSPDDIGVILDAAKAAIAAGELVPLPTMIFPSDAAGDAFRLMAQARHIGKVLIAPPRRAAPDTPRRFAARPDRSYLVTGGLGGLGLLTAQWLVEHGARALALFARSAGDTVADSAIETMRANGVTVLIIHGDIADGDDVSQLFGDIREKLPPLAGIIHSAGVLDDGAIVNQSWPRIEEVLRPKIDGTWNLHIGSADQPLELFVCYSSASAILGSPGQANHAAANAFQDALIHHRRALGLPGLSINWGAWSAIGAAANANTAGHIASFGVATITPAEGLAALEMLLVSGEVQATVARVRWDQFLADARPKSEQAPFAGLATPTMSRAAKQRPNGVTLDLARLPAVERRGAVSDLIGSSLAAIIGLDSAATLEPRRALRDLGLDSLMSVELRNWLQAALGQSLPATLIFDFPTIAALVDHICQDMAEKEAPHVIQTIAIAPEPAIVSADEAEAVLMAELALTREFLR